MRFTHRLAGDTRLGSDLHFFDLKTEFSLLHHGDIDEVYDVGTQEGMCDAVPREAVRRDDDVCACGTEMLLGFFFTGSGDDLEFRIERTRGEDNVGVAGVGGGGGDESRGAVNAGFSKYFFLGGIADHYQKVGGEAIGFRLIAFDDEQWDGLASKFARGAAADTSSAADNVVPR